MSPDLLIAWLMVFLRSIGVILQLPVVVGRPIPVVARLGVSVCLANLMAGMVPAARVSYDLWSLAGSAVGEVIVGLALGFVVRFAFAAVEMAGRVIASEIGLSVLPGMGAPEPASEPLAAILGTFAVILFFLFGGHHGVLTAFARSFQHAPAGRALLDPFAADSLIQGTAGLIELGLRIAAPFIAMNFLVTLAFAVLARAVPKTNVFIVSMPARSLMGIGLLGVAGSLLGHYLYVEFGETPLRMLQLLPVR